MSLRKPVKQVNPALEGQIESLRYWQLLAIILLLSGFLLPRKTLAQTEPLVSLTAQTGLDGYCKINHWFPVRVTMENNGADLEGWVEVTPVDTSIDKWRYTQAVSLPGVSRKEVTVFVYPKRNISKVAISFSTGDGIISKIVMPVTCVPPGDSIYGVWAAIPSVFNPLTALAPPGGRASLAQLELADFPNHSQGFDMLDILVISGVDTGPLTNVQRQAIANWVSNGGRLVIAGGPSWQKTAAGLDEFLPLHPNDSVTLASLSSLETFSRAAESLDGNTVVAVGDLEEAAIVIASQDEIPLIIRSQTGFGEVYYFAPDLAIAPLRSWLGIEDLYGSLFGPPLDVPAWAGGFTTWRDTADALANVPGLGLPSVFLICGFLGLYVLALGPLNYLILYRIKRRELAWITIPVLVLLFSGVAFIVGIAIRGNRPVINELAIVEIWPENEQARVHGLIGVFSPRRKTYRLEVGGNFLAHPIPSGQFTGDEDWRFEQTKDGIAVPKMRIDVGGIEAVAIVGEVPAPAFSQDLSLRFTNGAALVEGSIQNSSQVTLRDAIVLGPGQAIKIGSFSPGERKEIQLTISATTANPNGNPLINAPHSFDNTMQDIFGTNFVNSFGDEDLARRFNLLRAAFGRNGSRGGGVYLVGWANEAPLEVTLPGSRFRSEQTAIYIVALIPGIVPTAGETIRLPPSLFTWSIFETSTSNQDVSPYNTYVYHGVYSIRYQFNQSIQYERVQSLTLHLKSRNDSGPVALIFSLWDFGKNQWVKLPALSWGNYEVPAPSRFVGLGGEIRLQIENPSQQGTVRLDEADFTLVVE